MFCKQSLHVRTLKNGNADTGTEIDLINHTTFQMNSREDTVMTVEPPSQGEIEEYGRWLGLGEEDGDLVWIAKQALQTSIPSPWIECEAEEGDVFYFNTRTKESIWDHPFDAYYKGVIKRFKSNQCSKDDLVKLVSQNWLLSGVDNRPSHLSVEVPQSPKPTAEDVSPRNRRISSGSNISRVSVSPPDETTSHRRKSADDSPKDEVRTENTSLRLTPDLDLPGAYGRINDLNSQNTELRKRHRQETDSLTRDLIKSREFIELLIHENRALKKRMTEASSKVSGMRAETIILKERLLDEIRRREAAEERVDVLEDQVGNLKAVVANNSRRNSTFLSKLCGSDNHMSASDSLGPLNGIRSGSSEHITPTKQLSAATMNTTTSPELYRDILNLLSAPTSPSQPPVSSPAK